MAKRTDDQIWAEATEAMNDGMHSVLNCKDFEEAWIAWWRDRAERRIPLTRRAVQLQIKRLETAGLDAALQALEVAIDRGYRGVFPGNNGRVRGGTHKYDRWN